MCVLTNSTTWTKTLIQMEQKTLSEKRKKHIHRKRGITPWLINHVKQATRTYTWQLTLYQHIQASWQTYPPHALTVIFDFTLNLLLTVKFAEEVECNHSIDEYNSSCHERCHQQLQEVKVTKRWMWHDTLMITECRIASNTLDSIIRSMRWIEK